MNESNNLPQSISHKKLNNLLRNAAKDSHYSCEESNEIADIEIFQDAINKWELATKNIIGQISSQNEKVFRNKSSNSVMALGAMEAHLNMALQALKAYRNN